MNIVRRVKYFSVFVNQPKSYIKTKIIFPHRPYATNSTANSTQIAINEKHDENKAKQYVNPFSEKIDMEKTPTEQHVPEEMMTKEVREERLKVLKLEVDIAFQEGRRVPSLEFIEDSEWDHILTLKSKSARYKYYSYLWDCSMKKLAKERKKIERAEAVLQRKEEMKREREENKHIIYGLGHCSFFLRIYDSTINHWQNHRLMRAMLYSPKVVLDCGYDKYMVRREALNAAKQLMLCFAENRAHDDPFDLHFCNVNLSSTCMQSLKRFIPTMLNSEFPMNIHEKCFTEVFPKERLVYLTPHCRNDLTEYNHDDIYIIGAMVDTVNNEPLSLAKAKKLGLRMARLPLDRYLQWGSGSGKSLTLNQMIHVMLDLKSTGDWEKALLHVPRRKIVNIEREMLREKINFEKRAGKLNIRMQKILSDAEIEEDNMETNKRKFRNTKEFNINTWTTKRRP